MKRIKKVFGGGDLKRFKKSLKKFQERGDNFVVESKGLSRSIIFDSGIKFKYFPSDKVHQIYNLEYGLSSNSKNLSLSTTPLHHLQVL